MLMLLFWIGNERWAIAAADIKDVLPLVNLQRLPHSHPTLAGLLNYRGDMIRTLDISNLITGQAAKPIMSTRIVVVEVAGEPLGLVVERAEETAQLTLQNTAVGHSAYAQATLQDEQGVIQQLALETLPTKTKTQAPDPASEPAQTQPLIGVH
ncbi:MAG: chemotaxis protein CheW [Phormidesmis sp.]